MPSDNARICNEVFSTLRDLVSAAASGDDATIRRLVLASGVARKIEAWGAAERRKGLIEVHVVPTLTLGASSRGRVGAGFNIVGKTHAGNITAPQTLYMVLRHGTAYVAADQPEQEW